jgi:hypothetical protein
LGGKHEIEDGHVAERSMLPHDRLRTIALRVGFAETLALPPVLAACPTHERLFFEKDQHWTSAGTRCAAPAVARLIAREIAGQP